MTFGVHNSAQNSSDLTRKMDLIFFLIFLAEFPLRHLCCDVKEDEVRSLRSKHVLTAANLRVMSSPDNTRGVGVTEVLRRRPEKFMRKSRDKA